MRGLMQEIHISLWQNHATERLNMGLSSRSKIWMMTLLSLTHHNVADYCKGEDTVLAYQNYYILEKSGFAKWTKRESSVLWRNTMRRESYWDYMARRLEDAPMLNNSIHRSLHKIRRLMKSEG